MGVEPTLPPWQGSRLPLHHGRVCLFNCQRSTIRRIDRFAFQTSLTLNRGRKAQEHRVGVEPTSSHYESEILAARRPVLVSVQNLDWGVRNTCAFLIPHSPFHIGVVGLEGLEPSPNWVRASHAAITPQSQKCCSFVCYSFGCSLFLLSC